MKVLIIGGGIGGPVAAMALQRAGIEAEVFESHAGPGEHIGLFLTLAVNGMRMLRRVGAIDAVLREDVIPTPRMEFHSTTGKRLGSVSNGWLDPETPGITLTRGALQKALLEEAERQGVAVRYGARLRDWEETANGVVAHFEDGTKAQGDVLVGADGIHSRVRAHLLPDGPAPDFTGLLNVGGFVKRSELSATPDHMHMLWGKRAFFGWTVRPNGEAWWFANVGADREPTRDELKTPGTERWKVRLQELFAGDPPFISKLIEQTARIDATPIHDLRTLPRWHSGRAVLLGDAAHAVSPSAGQGASLAMEDAVALALCLLDGRSHDEAFARYESMRRARAERIVADGRRRGVYKAPGNPVSLYLRDLFMPLALRVFARESALSWIYDYDLPE